LQGFARQAVWGQTVSSLRNVGVGLVGKMMGAVLLCGAISPAMASAASQNSSFERQVLAALNNMRAEPAAHVGDLQSYSRNLRGKLATMPGTKVVYRTAEGAAPVYEAVSFLRDMDGRARLVTDDVLAAAAADHVSEQRRSGNTGHYGSDGSSPSVRVTRRGGGQMVTEVIAYGAFDATDVVRQLVIDDGVPGRGHRKAVFGARLRYAGVACGPHPTFRTMCVIEMAESPGGRVEGYPRINIALAE
jgi:uncharacterized protein YkwD